MDDSFNLLPLPMLRGFIILIAKIICLFTPHPDPLPSRGEGKNKGSFGNYYKRLKHFLTDKMNPSIFTFLLTPFRGLGGEFEEGRGNHRREACGY
jgi:hypothetical protein